MSSAPVEALLQSGMSQDDEFDGDPTKVHEPVDDEDDTASAASVANLLNRESTVTTTSNSVQPETAAEIDRNNGLSLQERQRVEQERQELQRVQLQGEDQERRERDRQMLEDGERARQESERLKERTMRQEDEDFTQLLNQYIETWPDCPLSQNIAEYQQTEHWLRMTETQRADYKVLIETKLPSPPPWSPSRIMAALPQLASSTLPLDDDYRNSPEYKMLTSAQKSRYTLAVKRVAKAARSSSTSSHRTASTPAPTELPVPPNASPTPPPYGPRIPARDGTPPSPFVDCRKVLAAETQSPVNDNMDMDTNDAGSSGETQSPKLTPPPRTPTFSARDDATRTPEPDWSEVLSAEQIQQLGAMDEAGVNAYLQSLADDVKTQPDATEAQRRWWERAAAYRDKHWGPAVIPVPPIEPLEQPAEDGEGMVAGALACTFYEFYSSIVTGSKRGADVLSPIKDGVAKFKRKRNIVLGPEPGSSSARNVNAAPPLPMRPHGKNKGSSASRPPA